MCLSSWSKRAKRAFRMRGVRWISKGDVLVTGWLPFKAVTKTLSCSRNQSITGGGDTAHKLSGSMRGVFSSIGRLSGDGGTEGPDSSAGLLSLARAHEWLVQLYQAWGRTAKAAEWQRK
jgi:hypothetical protein